MKEEILELLVLFVKDQMEFCVCEAESPENECPSRARNAFIVADTLFQKA